MRRLYLTNLLLWCFLMLHQTVWADTDPNVIVFQETFNTTSGTGGRDDKYDGNVASSTIKYDQTGWTGSYVYGGSQCLRFGSSSNNGTCTTPSITPTGSTHALLTFSAAGWGDSKKNTLTITASDGVTLTGDTSIELVNQEWNDYTVLISLTSAASVQLTFTGKRGFLDDVVVRSLTTVPAPTLPEGGLFWPNTTEAQATRSVSLIPVNYTTVRYTTDGSLPTTSHGSVTSQTANISISGTTTVKAIAYVGDMTSTVVSQTYEQGSTVSGMAAFRALADNTEARLFLADDNDHEVRVLYYDESSHLLFLRDKDQRLCINLADAASINPVPKYNQHVAGWIVGRKTTADGLLKMEATGNTTTNYLIFADPVTEEQTVPASIDMADAGQHIGDWVTLAEQQVGSSLTVSDRFGTGAYTGALADLSGIVTAGGDGTVEVSPVSQNGIPAVIYVLDESREFVSPASDIAEATVRLKRTLSKDYWNTLTLPFSVAAMEGSVREYDHASGSTMVFKNASTIEAGKPYLVKPADDISNPVYQHVTLASAPAQTVSDGGYSFVATYSPRSLASDQTELFLTTAGRLAYPSATSSALKGLRAYFQVPAGAPVGLLFDDATGIIELSAQPTDGMPAIYNLNGQRIAQPKQGLYIINGKKIMIR